MSRISDLIAAIRTAVYGEQVRGAIADSIQECYDDVSTAKTLADDATFRANTAAGSANSAAEAANAAAAAVPVMIAETFSPNVSYAEGRYVYKDGYLYRFTSPHAAGAWNSSQVTRVYLSLDVFALKNTVDDINDDVVSLEATIAGKQDALTFDNVPMANSNNPVKSGGIYTAVSTEMSRAQSAENQKVNKPIGNQNGTSGQLLRTNGDGTTAWVDIGLPTDQQVGEAIDSWLDDHPEATTTVVDGSITRVKLATELSTEIDDKAPAIIDDTAKENSHTGLTGVRKITFYGNSSAFSNGRYINAKNYLPLVTKSWTVDSGNLSLQAAGHFVIYNGTPAERSNAFVFDSTLDTPIPAGTYKWRVELSGTMTVAPFYLSVFYESAPTTRVQAVYSYVGGSQSNELEFTLTEKVVKIGYKVGYAKNEVYSNFAVWMGIYDSTATVVDTGLTVSSSGTQEYTNAALFNLPTIDTMQHESVIAYTADTKTYVDAHTPDIIGYWNDHVYALPEDFGAVGDGTTDDTQALVDCIAYSASSGKPVRGFAKYKTTSTLLINTRYQDVYLKYLVYTGNDAAIQLSERNITLGFDVIESSGIGILFQRYSTQSCQMHVVTGNRIKATGDCVKATGNTYYNTVTVRSMESTAGNCIEFDNSTITGNISEYTFRDCSFACPAGWAGKNLFGAKLYGCTVEDNVLNGYLNPINCTFIGCRHREFTDAVGLRVVDGVATKTNGPLIKYTINPTYHGSHGLKYITADGIPWCSIDVSEVQGYDSLPQASQGDDTPQWNWLAYNGIDVGSAVKGIKASGFTVIGANMYFVGMNKVFVPGARTIYTFDKATYDMTLFEGQTDADILAAYNQGGWGTDFICGYSHTDYYMNASFGAVGYNDLTLTQQNGNTATIYDKLGNVIFDGTNAGNGVWSLKCKVDRSKHGRCSSYTENGWWCYDGTNETWEVTKLS